MTGFSGGNEKEMISVAKSRFVRISPYKLRSIVDGIRGKGLGDALLWLKVQRMQRIVPVLKTLQSAWANARDKDPSFGEVEKLTVALAKVDQGPTFRYHKPGAMGRSVIQRKRLCHIEIGLSAKQLK
ncbi:50S ribosomal protein L22 [Candidatus Babeliales bacterium]|nr:50S ribosomal protein L22 [Candidatus Babeliales bacterium]